MSEQLNEQLRSLRDDFGRSHPVLRSSGGAQWGETVKSTRSVHRQTLFPMNSGANERNAARERSEH